MCKLNYSNKVISGDYEGLKLRVGRYHGARLIKPGGFIDINRNNVKSITTSPTETNVNASVNDVYVSNAMDPVLNRKVRKGVDIKVRRKSGAFFYKTVITFINGKTAELILNGSTLKKLTYYSGVYGEI